MILDAIKLIAIGVPLLVAFGFICAVVGALICLGFHVAMTIICKVLRIEP